jgi:LuxR family maltose regulon positive regulatory protein
LAEQHVGPNSAATALPVSLLAQIRYEQGRMDEAEGMLFDRLPILSATAMLDCVLSAYVVLVRLAACRMNHSRAYALLEQAENLGLTRHWGRLVAWPCSNECGSLAWKADFRRAPPILIAWIAL